MSERLTLQDLVDLLSQQQDITKKDAEAFLRELITLISETVEQNEPVRIKDFGTFKLVKVNARKSVNVNTGEEIEIAAHYKLTFTPDKSLRDAINKPFSHFESVVIEDGVDFENTKVTTFDIDIDDTGDELDIDIINEELEEVVSEMLPPLDEEVLEEELEIDLEPTDSVMEVEEFSTDVSPPLVEADTEIIEEPINKVGSAVEEMSASMDAFRNNKKITEEDNKILASLTLNQSEYKNIGEWIKHNSPQDEDAIDATEEIREELRMSEEEQIREEEKEKAARLEETINKLLAKSKAREVAPLAIEKINEVEKEPIVEITPPSVEEEVIESTDDVPPTIEAIVEDKNEDEDIVEQSEPVIDDSEPTPILKTNDMNRANYDNEEDEDDDDMYEYDNGNKKTYIYLGIALVVIIAAIAFMKFYPRNVDPALASNDAVADSIVNQIKDSIEADTTKLIEAIEPTKEKVAKESPAVSEPAKDNKKSVADLGTETLQKGQTLRLISLKYYGHKSFWVYIYQVNKSKIKDPNNVSVGTKLTIPSLDKFNVNPKNQKEIDKAKKMEGEILRGTAK